MCSGSSLMYWPKPNLDLIQCYMAVSDMWFLTNIIFSDMPDLIQRGLVKAPFGLYVGLWFQDQFSTSIRGSYLWSSSTHGFIALLSRRPPRTRHGEGTSPLWLRLEAIEKYKERCLACRNIPWGRFRMELRAWHLLSRPPFTIWGPGFFFYPQTE
jgi:hypothetical protein